MFQIGDWVLAKEMITEEDFNGVPLWTHAHPGSVGHVLEQVEGGLNVFFEHAGTVTVCFEEDLEWLCGPDGRKPTTGN
jgi:hypothetical protein